MDNSSVLLTELGLEKIKKELDHYINVRRKEVAGRIEYAKDLGDLSENAEYSDAKEEQARVETRIAELTAMVRNAVIIEPTSATNGFVVVGSSVEVKNEKNDKKTFQIVGSQEADPAAGKISNESPIGRLLIGKKVGDTVTYKSPRGILVFDVINIF